jgi:hypothetical protein
MAIKQATTREFQDIMQSDYNVNLGFKEANQQLNNLVDYFNQLIDIESQFVKYPFFQTLNKGNIRYSF